MFFSQCLGHLVRMAVTKATLKVTTRISHLKEVLNHISLNLKIFTHQTNLAYNVATYNHLWLKIPASRKQIGLLSTLKRFMERNQTIS